MSEKLKQCPFCGGEAHLSNWSDGAYVWCECGVKTEVYLHSGCVDKAIEAWNRRAERTERTAKAIEHDASVTDTDGYKYHRSEYLCGACKKKVLGGDDYCSHCGAKLDWGEA